MGDGVINAGWDSSSIDDLVDADHVRSLDLSGLNEEALLHHPAFQRLVRAFATQLIGTLQRVIDDQMEADLGSLVHDPDAVASWKRRRGE